jgi:hypothetical protein
MTQLVYLRCAGCYGARFDAALLQGWSRAGGTADALQHALARGLCLPVRCPWRALGGGAQLAQAG